MNYFLDVLDVLDVLDAVGKVAYSASLCLTSFVAEFALRVQRVCLGS